MNSPLLLLLLKENNRTCEKPRQEEMLSWSGALGLAQAFCCVSAESSQAATPHSGLRLPKLPLHLSWKPVLLQIEMGIHGPEVCQGSKGPRLWLPLIDPMEQLEDLPPSWGLSGIHSRSCSSTPPRGSVSTWAIPHASLPVFHELTQPSLPFSPVSLCQACLKQAGRFRSCWGGTNIREWLGEIEAHFVRKQHRCWLLCHGSEQRSQAVKQPKDLGVSTQKNQYLDELGNSQMSKIPHW